MSVWATDALSKPIEHGKKGGIWDSSLLSDNVVIELNFAQKADACSGADAAFASASDLGAVTLKWEEVIAAPQVNEERMPQALLL